MNERNQSNDLHSLSHTKWNCKYHVVFAPKYRRAVFYDSKRIQEYIRNQLKEDKEAEQLSLDLTDPFSRK